jgi:hypothetical protein
MRYEDFSILFGPTQDSNEFAVIVDRSPAGQARGTFRMPFSEEELAALQERLGRFVRANRGGVRSEGEEGNSGAASRLLDPKIVGDLLFRALFSGEVGKLLDRSLAKVEGTEELGLRIRLVFPAGEKGFARLTSLPWETLYWQEKQRFLSLSRTTPVVRSLEISLAANAQPVQPPLRILAVASRAGIPADVVKAECDHLRAACAELPDVELSFVPAATTGSLRQALHDGRFHVLHFLGHGAVNRSTGEGALLFEKEDGGDDIVPAAAFAELVHDFHSLRLVVLTACESSRMPGQEGLDPFGSVASALLLAGLPAVVAMQYRVSGDASDLFTAAFYRRLAAGDPVDAAASEGRMALHLRDSGSPEWATPVFFLRAADSQIVESRYRAPEQIRAEIIDFSRLIEDKTAGFVGRRWLFESIDRFTRERSAGYFVVRGDPGIGKSALMARMVKDGGHVHHFNIRSEGIQKPETFLRNVCAQLIAKYHLDYSFLPPDATQSSMFFGTLLGKAAGRLATGQRVLVLVDALDESDATALSPGANLLYLPANLPKGVYLVVTTRRSGPALRIECDQEVLDLEQDLEGNVADIRELVEGKLQIPGIRAYVTAQGLDDERFVMEMVGKSQGNFMYLRYVLPEIERGTYRNHSIDTLPAGLVNYYEDHWRRLRARDESAWFGHQLPVLVALTAVKEPVSIDLIAEFSEIADRRQIRAVLQEWDQFLYTAQALDDEGRPQKRYRLYHESFYEFVAAKDEVADERVNLKKAHGRIADVLWRDLYGNSFP